MLLPILTISSFTIVTPTLVACADSNDYSITLHNVVTDSRIIVQASKNSFTKKEARRGFDIIVELKEATGYERPILYIEDIRAGTKILDNANYDVAYDQDVSILGHKLIIHINNDVVAENLTINLRVQQYKDVPIAQVTPDSTESTVSIEPAFIQPYKVTQYSSTLTLSSGNTLKIDKVWLAYTDTIQPDIGKWRKIDFQFAYDYSLDADGSQVIITIEPLGMTRIGNHYQDLCESLFIQWSEEK